ncbi:hypothetical protein V1281_002575 [Nitrobacteraceae bacterium AZCC 2161]
MSDKPIEVIIVGQWKVGFSKSSGHSLLMFEFSDRGPINLAIDQAQAVEIANAILAQQKNTPSKPDQMN